MSKVIDFTTREVRLDLTIDDGELDRRIRETNRRLEILTSDMDKEAERLMDGRFVSKPRIMFASDPFGEKKTFSWTIPLDLDDDEDRVAGMLKTIGKTYATLRSYEHEKERRGVTA